MKRILLLGLTLWITGAFFTPLRGQGALTNADITGSYAFTLAGSGGDQIQFSVPGTLNQGVPLLVVPNGTPGAFCDSPTNPCFQVNFASPTPQLTFPAATPLSIVGTFVADGNGKITGGSGFVFQQHLQTLDGMTYTVRDNSCNFTLTGTYSLTAAGNTLTINPVGPCVSSGLSATFTLLPGNVERKDGVEFGVMYLSAPIANPGSFSTFLMGSFFKQ